MYKIVFLLLLSITLNAQSFVGLTLRDVVYFPYTTKGKTLTYQEVDNNFINLGNAIRNLQSTVAPPPDLSGYIPRTGTTLNNNVTGDIKFNDDVKLVSSVRPGNFLSLNKTIDESNDPRVWLQATEREIFLYSTDAIESGSSSLQLSPTAASLSGATAVSINSVGGDVMLSAATSSKRVGTPNKLFRLNHLGAANTGGGVGIEVFEDIAVSGYLKTSTARTGWQLKSPATAGIATLVTPAANQTYTFPAQSGTLALTSDIVSGGSGTVTSVTSGSLSPLFSASVATNTTTPAFSFTAISQAANKGYFGPTTGVDAAPTFRSLVEADLPTISDSKISSASIWNAKLSGSGTLNQIPYYTAANTLTSNNSIRRTGGLDFPNLWIEGTNSPSHQVYSTSSDNTGNSSLNLSVNGRALEFKSHGISATGNAFGSVPNEGNQTIKASGDLILLPEAGAGKVYVNDGSLIVDDNFVHSSVPVKIDNLANSANNVVVANSTGVLSTSRFNKTLAAYSTPLYHTTSGEADFYEYLIPANTLTANGDAIEYEFVFQAKTSNTTNTMTGNIRFGTELVGSITISSTNFVQCSMVVKVVRTSSTTAVVLMTTNNLPSNTIETQVSSELSSLNFASGISFKSSVSTSAPNVIYPVICFLGKVNFEPAP